MAYTLISSNTLASNTASVTFSSIPSTYKDLALRISVRTTLAGATVDSIRMTINSSTANQSSTRVSGDGSVVTSTRGTGYSIINSTDGNSGTASTFSNLEIYIPSYTASQNKPMSRFSVVENNSTTAGDTYIYSDARLWSITSAITDLSFDAAGVNLAAGSSFYLYGIN